MFKRNLGCAVLLAMATLQGALAADYRGPLERPAEINTQLAQSNRLTAVARAGAAIVAVGPRGHILLSDAAAQGWQQVAVPVASDLVAVRFVDAVDGWAVGHDGVVLHSADGGKRWSVQLDGKKAAALADVHFKTASAGGDAQLLAQKDAVARFVEEGADKPFLDVLFLNKNEGFVVGAFNAAFRTVDGGRNWTPLLWSTDNPTYNHIYALAVHGGELYAAGERGLLLRWDREQQRFTALVSPYKGSFFGLLDAGKELVAYGLRGSVYASADAGATWRKLATPALDSVVGATLLPGGRYLLATRGGKLWRSKEDGSGFDVMPAKQPMSYAAVAAAGTNTIVTVGSGGVRTESITPSVQEK